MGVKDRGFANMDRDKVSAIASMGGKAAHALGVAHEWSSAEAVVAGRKGHAEGARRRRERIAGEQVQGNAADTPATAKVTS